MKIRLRLREEGGVYFPEYLRYPWSRKWKPFLYTRNLDYLPFVYTRKFSTWEEGLKFLGEKERLGFWRFRSCDCDD